MELRSGAMPEEPPRPAAEPVRSPVPPSPPPSPGQEGGRPPAGSAPPAAGAQAPGAQTAGEQAAGAQTAGPQTAGAPGQRTAWRADRRLTIFKIVGLLVFLAAALLVVSDPVGTSLLLIAALVCAVYAARDLLAPVRLSADATGVTVIHGYLGHARLAWSEIDRVGVDRHSRLGLRTELLEIDAGERLYLLSSYDLSADPADVTAALLRLRTGG